MNAHKDITIVGLIQVLIIISGFLAIGIHMKAMGYPDDDEMIRWNPAALFVREHVLVLLLLPILWTVYSLVGEFSARFAQSKFVSLSLGITLTVALAAFLIVTFCDVGTQKLILAL